MRVRLYRGDRPSNGARALAAESGIRLVRTNRSRFVAREGDIVVNWGTTADVPAALALADWWNHPTRVRAAVNKLATFKAWAGLPTVEWSESIADAQDWQRKGSVVMERHNLSGSAADGLRVVGLGEEIRPAPLYTRYFKGLDEYRIHVSFGEVIDRQKKLRRREHADPISNFVRNLEGGWIYARENIQAIAAVDEAATKAVESLGLDFGAIDLRFSPKSGRVGLLECNTAPGVEGRTVGTYAASFNRRCSEGSAVA